MNDQGFTRLMQELAFRAGRHAQIAKTLTMAAMVNWFVMNADLTTHVVAEPAPVVDMRKVYRNMCAMFKQNRNEIYGYGEHMQVLDVALEAANSDAAQVFMKDTPSIIGSRVEHQYAANNNAVTKVFVPTTTLNGAKEAVSIVPAGTVKTGKVIYLAQFLGNAA